MPYAGTRVLRSCVLCLSVLLASACTSGGGGPSPGPGPGPGTGDRPRGGGDSSPDGDPGDPTMMSDRPVACEESCPYSGDGECDDGGPGSMFSICTFGTDCMDCGRRDPSSCGCPSSQQCGRGPCGESCGECGDGQYCNDANTCVACMGCAGRTCGYDPDCGESCGECPAGQTCTEAGQCEACTGCGAPGCECASEDQYCSNDTACLPRAGTPLCNNTCRWAGDDECDDGAAGMITSLCEFGSDCEDCGPRMESDRPPMM